MGVAARTTAEINVARPDASRWAFWDRVGSAFSAISIAFAVGVLLVGLVLAFMWYNRPFLGVFFYPDGTVIGTRPLFNTTWVGLDVGIQPDDRLLRLDGRSLAGVENVGQFLNQVLSEMEVGQLVEVEVFRPRRTSALKPGCMNQTAEGATCLFSFRLMRFPLADFLGHFGIGFAVSVFAISLGLWLWLKHRRLMMARTLTTICMAGAVVFIARFEIVTTYYLTALMALGICVVAGLLVQVAVYFPYPLAVARRRPWMRPAVMLASLVLFGLYLMAHQLFPNTPIDVGLVLVLIVLVVSGMALIGSMFVKRHRATSALAREQAAVVLFSTLIPLLPALLWVVTNWLDHPTRVPGIGFSTVYLQLPVIIFPLGMAYAIFQRRGLDTDRILNEGIILTALGAMLVIGYMLVAGAAYTLTAGLIQPNSPVVIALVLFIVAVAFMPVRIYLENLLEKAFFKQRRLYEQRLQQFARTLTTAIEASDVVRMLQQELRETLRPQYMFVFLRNTASGEYEAVVDPETGRPQTDIRFGGDSALIRLLNTSQTVLDLERENISPAELQLDRPRLAVLNTPVIARLRSVRRLNGFIALGPGLDRAEYTHEDLRFLEGVANQAAAAFERAQVVLEAQRNERELQVLVQVSQGLNIAMDFDVLLEFIYAQINKIVSAPNFYIALRDFKTEELSFAFYQEYGERISEKEGLRWPMGRDLMSEVVRTQQPFRTDHYVREMQRRDSSNRIENSHLRAWLGVPLNAAEGQTLGCIAIASVDPTVTYTEDQTRILWSIADLAATAIYKTKLFDETAELARQMKILNDISSSLGTLFEDIDALLQRITESAVEILNSEAGSLLLVDENSSDLVFRYAVGGAGQGLVNSRIPAGSGIVGMVVMTGRHIIVNDPQSDPRWYGEVSNDEEKSGPAFTTNAILAVPLSARGRVIGVLEVINKRDGSGFGESDVNLLTTFASQAAIAIENANLFRLTDEALAERVKQLFNMQRIDQELNRTLDLQRVVDLTVDNAIRESAADAGALALISDDPPAFWIMGCAGYPERILKTGDSFGLDFSILGRVYETSEPTLLFRDTSTDGSGADFTAILPGSVNQLCVPLITGETVTGVLLLESTMPNTFNPMTAEHIQALAEHANTAITNARLFARLGEANQARIEIARIVAHELKNPMASIKGFAELMLGGMTGPLTERQIEFLSTIRRNTVRMQQMVDDLRDVTAQETGNLTLKLEAVNFTNAVLEAVRPQQRSFDEKGQKIILNVPEELPPVWGDENRLIQIMTNFISNANKYMPEGGTVTITAEVMENRWGSSGLREVIHCTVQDTGIGMSEEDLQQLFTPYWRSDNPLAREQPGTGLGMSLTRGLIEAHGGKVWVESTLDVGTTFHFTMPLATEIESA